MAWTYFPLTVVGLPTQGLQEKGIWQELEDALNERRKAIGLSDASIFTTFGNGDWNVQTATELADLQQKIEDLVPSFVNHGTSGGDYDGDSAVPAWEWNDTSATTGILHSSNANVGDGTDWTRRHGTADSLSTSYGQVTAGDVCHLYRESSTDKIAEYLNEMYRVLDLLRWSIVDDDFAQGGNEPYFTRVTTNIRAQRTESTTKSTADAAWTALVANYPGSFNTDDTTFRAVRKASINYDYSSGKYGAVGESVKLTLTLNDLTTDFDRACDLYGEKRAGGADDTYTEWEADGTGYVEDDVNLVESNSATNSATEAFSVINNDATLQDRPTSDPHTSSSNTERRGWQLDHWIAVIKWNVASGFTKVSATI